MEIPQVNGRLIPGRAKTLLVYSEPDAVPDTEDVIGRNQALACERIQQPCIDKHQRENGFDGSSVRIGFHGIFLVKGKPAGFAADSPGFAMAPASNARTGVSKCLTIATHTLTKCDSKFLALSDT
jgi:hypothetical protein